MPSARLRNVVVTLSSAVVLSGAGIVRAQAPIAPPHPQMNRTPDFVLVTKKCVRLASKVGGRAAPLHIDHPPGSRESCWRSGAELTCSANESPVTLRINRETGPQLFATGEGGLMMLSLDWASSSFANGITYFDDERGIAHIQCSGRVLSGDAAAGAQRSAPERKKSRR
jgi:hypothetical protein